MLLADIVAVLSISLCLIHSWSVLKHNNRQSLFISSGTLYVFMPSFTTWQCRWRNYVFGVSVHCIHPLFYTDLVTKVSWMAWAISM